MKFVESQIRRVVKDLNLEGKEKEYSEALKRVMHLVGNSSYIKIPSTQIQHILKNSFFPLLSSSFLPLLSPFLP